jgi:hypothetical protein
MAVQMVETNPGLTSTRVYQNAAALVGSDVTTPLMLPHYADKVVHVFGTFNGQTLTVQGSNETVAAPTDWETLHIVDGTTACAFTAAGIKQVLENCSQIRFSVSAGAGVSLTVIITASTSARR